MSMRDLIVLAMVEEAPYLINNYSNVFCIGVGKVNAAINTTCLIKKYRPKRIINFGTAGGLKLHTGIYRVNEVIQHDVNLTAIGLKPGEHLNDKDTVIRLGKEGYTCASGDLFVTEPTKLRVECDLVDMEAYSIAKACHSEKIECEIWKFVSDKADEKANTTWKEQVNAGEKYYMNILNVLNVVLEVQEY